MFPGRSRHDAPDFTSSAYLQTNSSYAEFLQQKEQLNGPSPRGSWRNDNSYSSPRPTFFRTDYREQNSGWRNEPSWRTSNPPRTESWIECRDIKKPPHEQGDSQRYIAPAAAEPRRHIAPAVSTPQGGPEMWREERPLYGTNWRKESSDSTGSIRRPPDFPPEFSSPGHNKISETRKSFKTRSSAEPRRKSPSYRLSPQEKRSADDEVSPIRDERISKYNGPPNVSPDRLDQTIPKRNRILPAEEDGRFHSEKNDIRDTVRKNGEILSDRRPPHERYEDDNSSWTNAGPSSAAFREDSWTAQYRKRVQAQKAEMRIMERQKSSETLPGPSCEPRYNYNDTYQPRVDSQSIERDDYYNEPDKEDIRNLSPGRKFFFVDRAKNQKHGGTLNQEKHQFFDDNYGKMTPTIVKNENANAFIEKSTINPNDYVEEFSDDEWNELDALVNKASDSYNGQSRKRPFEETPSPSKKPYIPSNLPTASGFGASSTTTPFRREPSQISHLSFFREEMPSIRSAAGFFKRTTPYVPPKNEYPPNNRQWDNGNYRPQYQYDQNQQRYGYR